MDHNIAVFSAHLPLDCHPEIGNNALLAKALELEVVDTFLNIKALTTASFVNRMAVHEVCLLNALRHFSKHLFIILYGSETPERLLY